MESKEFLYEYLNAYSPVAQEHEGQKIWSDYVSNYVDSMSQDTYGTSYGVLHGEGIDLPKVAIEAHCDEISWMISYIDNDGYVYVVRHGGSDQQIAPSKTVVVHTRKNGRIRGVFGWPAIHVRKDKEHNPSLDNNFIDFGAHSKEQIAEMGIEVGNIVTFDDHLWEMGDYYVGKALDNKIGGYIIAEVVRRIKEQGIKLPFDLYVINSVQEEVGLYGARMIANRIKPDVALVTDVCHITKSPMYNVKKDAETIGGKGCAIEHTAQNHRQLIELFRECGDENDIKYQLTIGSYGNDTMGFFLADGGIPTAIIATPLKYMHTTVEMAHKDDVESVIKMYIESLKNLTNKTTLLNK
jgi:putative aminopeptidase FrvX